VTRPWWVAVEHQPGGDPRGLVAYQAADAACACTYLLAWLSWYAPAIPPGFVFVNGVPLSLYLPADKAPIVYQSRQTLAKLALTKQRRLAKHRERWAKHNPPSRRSD